MDFCENTSKSGWLDAFSMGKLAPYFRQFNHKDITFSLMYAFSEHFILPLSHDEVVHMKGSLLNKIPAKYEEQFDGVRAFYTYMLTHPGKKLLMMGSEFGQWNEWHYESSLDWHLVDPETPNCQRNRQIQEFFKAANHLYLENPALWEDDFSWNGFQWICHEDHQANCVSFLRKGADGKPLVILCNFSPVHRKGYRLGVPLRGRWQVILNSDETRFGGSGLGDTEDLRTQDVPCHGQEQSIEVDLPPMASLILRCSRKSPPRKHPVKKSLSSETNQEVTI